MIRLFASALSLTFIAVASISSAQTAPTKVPAVFDKMYAPGGFDSNDHVQIVGEGIFRNTCYRHAETNVRIDNDNKKIFVSPVAYEYSGFCLQVILPFDRVIDIGLLKPGQWEVFQGASLKLGEINIRPATHENPDDYLYAPISQAFFRQKGLISEVLLTGEFPNECLSLDEVLVTVEPDVIVLKPVAKVDRRPDCKNGKFPFSKVVTIQLLPKGRYLLHVRSMNGKAVNSIVNVN